MNGLTYTDAGKADMKIGDDLGKASFLPCADTGGANDQGGEQLEQTNAYEIQGLDSQIAVAVGASAEDAELFALEQPGGGLPDQVQQFIDRGKQ